MKEKLSLQKKHKIIQDSWTDSPCRLCNVSPCCSVVPLAPMKLLNRTDFINLALLSCYDNIRLGLKKSGEWSVYYSQDCRFLSAKTSKCTIHSGKFQSLICKSYDAHKCWYKPAFKNNQNEKIIFFDLSRLLLFEKMTGLLQNGYIKNKLSWEKLIELYSEFPLEPDVRINASKKLFYDNSLLFKQSTPEHFLFFSPYDRPGKNIHFELITFRLGFYGMNLAIADNNWAYILSTNLNKEHFSRLKQERFPSIKAENGSFSFSMLKKKKWFHSGIGEKWVIAELEHIKPIKSITKFDFFGNVRKFPGAKEVLFLLRKISPK